MVDILSNLFNVIGLDLTFPATLPELIPYFIRILFAVALVGGIFGWVKSLSTSITGRRLF